jgi:hypothetical protein
VDALIDHGSPALSARLEALIAQCQADRGSHMTGGGCDESELRAVEDVLLQPLPPDFRLFLSRLGGGVFYLEHEIFGARRVMIHDIEMVPDLLSFRTWLGRSAPADLLPVHRAGGRIHAIELGRHPCSSVRSLSDAVVYPDFSTFLQHVVLP